MVSKENGCDRAFVLFCTCMLTFGSYYVFDMPRYVLGTHITCESLSSKSPRCHRI
jgi:hypothetical protein